MPKLLIVDDELDVREFVANFFRKRKLEVVTAKNGEEAISTFSKHLPDLTLLDIKMGDMDGIEALRRIKEINPQASVVMLTGQRPEDDDAYKRCKDLGALDYIHKPLELDTLEKAVNKQINAMGVKAK